MSSRIQSQQFVREATAELEAARMNLNEVVDALVLAEGKVEKASTALHILQETQAQVHSATLALSAALRRVRQGEALLRSAHAALDVAH